ncbi:MAG: hypothetical protein WBP72_10430 [Rhodocyclaceae bacterium]
MTNSSFPPPAFSNPLESPRVLDLKRRVGFDAALAAEKKTGHVAMDWERFPVPDVLREWAFERELDRLSDAESLLTMTFKRGESKVTIEVSVFAPSERTHVAVRLLERANAVTTVALSDERGPKDLGTLALVPKAPTAPVAESFSVVYWIFRNVFAEVSAFKTPLSAIDIARWVQRQFELNVRPG